MAICFAQGLRREFLDKKKDVRIVRPAHTALSPRSAGGLNAGPQPANAQREDLLDKQSVPESDDLLGRRGGPQRSGRLTSAYHLGAFDECCVRTLQRCRHR